MDSILEKLRGNTVKRKKILMTQDTMIGFAFDVALLKNRREEHNADIKLKEVHESKNLKMPGICVCFTLSIDVEEDIAMLRLVDETGEIIGCINKYDLDTFSINTNSTLVIQNFSIWRLYKNVINLVAENIITVYS